MISPHFSGIFSRYRFPSNDEPFQILAIQLLPRRYLLPILPFPESILNATTRNTEITLLKRIFVWTLRSIDDQLQVGTIYRYVSHYRLIQADQQHGSSYLNYWLIPLRNQWLRGLEMEWSSGMFSSKTWWIINEKFQNIRSQCPHIPLESWQ